MGQSALALVPLPKSTQQECLWAEAYLGRGTSLCYTPLEFHLRTLSLSLVPREVDGIFYEHWGQASHRRIAAGKSFIFCCLSVGQLHVSQSSVLISVFFLFMTNASTISFDVQQQTTKDLVFMDSNCLASLSGGSSTPQFLSSSPFFSLSLFRLPHAEGYGLFGSSELPLRGCSVKKFLWGCLI